MNKQFTKKQIEKLFKTMYPTGEISLEKNDMWYCTESESYCYSLNRCTLYDVAEQLNLVPIEQIKEMKQLAGYRM